MSRFLKRLLAGAAAVVSLGASVASADSLYVYPAGYYAVSDPSKNAGNNYGFQFSLGYDFEHLSVELLSETPGYKSSSASGDLKSHGASLDARYRFLEGPLRPFVIAGGGWMRTNDDLGGYGSYLARAGLGVEWMLPKWGLGVRADAVVRHEFASGATGEKPNLNDAVSSVGVTYHFGGSKTSESPQPTQVRYEPPTAVAPPLRNALPATKPPATGLYRPSSGLPDSDGDGVDDAHDRCPDTPAGAAVDSDGCLTDTKH